MFGLRFALEEIRSGRAKTATDLSRALVERSGLPALRALLREHFAGRARTLKARSALNSLRAVGRRLEQVDGARGADLEAQIERVEAGAHELAELRLAHLALSGSARLSETEVAEVLRLTAPGDGPQRLGLDVGAPLDAVRDAALRGVERWRVRGENPALDPVTAQACEVAARSYEGLYVAATAAPSG